MRLFNLTRGPNSDNLYEKHYMMYSINSNDSNNNYNKNNNTNTNNNNNNNNNNKV
jgi:hypothetical protein